MDHQAGQIVIERDPQLFVGIAIQPDELSRSGEGPSKHHGLVARAVGIESGVIAMRRPLCVGLYGLAAQQINGAAAEVVVDGDTVGQVMLLP